MNINFDAYNKKVTNKDVIDYLRQNGGVLSYFVKPKSIISSVLFFVVLFVYSSFDTVKYIDWPRYIVTGLVLLFIFSLISYLFFMEIMKIRVLLTKFSNDNSFSYSATGGIDMKRPGFIFDIGHSRKYINIISSNDPVDNFEIANYQYTIGSGKNQRVVNVGYIAIKLDRKLPHMILDSVKNNSNFFGMSVSNLPISIKKDQFLSLEGDFDSYFKLYAPKDYEADALYIFNPLLMQKFIIGVDNFDAEIVDDYLFIYSLNKIDFMKKQVVSDIFSIIETAMSQVKKSSRYYRDDKATSDFNQNIVGSSGIRLKKRVNLGTIFFVIMTIALVISWIVPFFD